MTDILKQTIKEEIEKLAPNIQAAIASTDWVKVTEEVGTKFSLNETELNDFQVETLLALTGIEDPEMYPSNLEDNVGLDKETSGKITDEVVKKIFTPLANWMTQDVKKNMQGKKWSAVQNVNFILSNGSYATLMGKTEEKIEEKPKVITLNNSNRIIDIKNKL